MGQPVTTANYQPELAVSYEGLAFTEHTMEVRDLAPALLALGQAFDRANVLLNGNRASISLNILATRPGSFEVGLLLHQELEGASAVLAGGFLASAADLTELIVGSSRASTGLISLIKKLRGKKPSIGDEQSGGVVLTAENIRLNVPTEVVQLYIDKSIRGQLEAFVRPLAKEGVDRVVFRQSKEELESVRSEEATYFSADLDSDSVTEHVIPRQRLRISTLSFGNERKWQLSDGDSSHWYFIEDVEFYKAIQQGRRFGKEDTLICEVLMTQRVDNTNTLKLEYSVKRVIEHIIHGEQIPFQIIGDDPD